MVRVGAHTAEFINIIKGTRVREGSWLNALWRAVVETVLQEIPHTVPQMHAVTGLVMGRMKQTNNAAAC